MLSSYTVNIAYHANNPDVGMSLEKDAGRYKLFNSDVGLFITLAFKDKKYTYIELLLKFCICANIAIINLSPNPLYNPSPDHLIVQAQTIIQSL